MIVGKLRTTDEISQHMLWHAQKILQMQDQNGNISSFMEFTDRGVQKKGDLPRQALACMALSFASPLIPALEVEARLQASIAYILNNIQEESQINKQYVYLYLALSDVYAGQDPTFHIESLEKFLTNEIFQHPIALGLYLRLSSLLPTPLLHTAYIGENVRYSLSTTPRAGRFFDFADTLVWAVRAEHELVKREYTFLLKHKTEDDWFAYVESNIRATASVVGKLFEVLAFHPHFDALAQDVYERLMRQRAVSQYAKDTLGVYAEHILSEQHTLRIDDVHSHILIGLCYRYQLVARHKL